MTTSQLPPQEKKPIYIVELEKVYNRYLVWDRDNVRYSFTLYYNDNIVGNSTSLERSYIGQRTTGAERFKKAYEECLSILNPKGLLIYEFNGMSNASKPLSAFPIVIRIIDEPKTVIEPQLGALEQPKKSLSLQGLLSGFGVDLEGENNGLGQLFAFQKQIYEKDTEIIRCQNEIYRLQSEINRLISESDVKSARMREEHISLVSDYATLEKEIEEKEDLIEELQERIESLQEENDNHQKNGSIQKSLVSGVSTIAYNVLKNSSKAKSFLGIDDSVLDGLSGVLGVESIQQQEPVAPRRPVEDYVDEPPSLSPEEQERKDLSDTVSKYLIENYTEKDEILNILKIIELLANEPVVQVQLIQAIQNGYEERRKASRETASNSNNDN